MFIKNEEPEDFGEIYDLIKVAFKTAEFSDGDEQDYAVNLRKSGRYIPELAFIAVEDNRIIGQIMLTKNYIETKTGKLECLLLGPVCVALEHRKKGVGASLINNALNTAKNLNYKAVLLCGDPDYYGKLGFLSVSNYKIKPVMNIPVKYVLACELEKGWLKSIEGSIDIM